MSKRIYISGPMRGQPNNNRGSFDSAERRFEERGWRVDNPASLDACCGDTPLRTLLEMQLIGLMDCDAIALLPGWSGSRGAIAELALSQAVDPPMPVYDAFTCEPMAAESFAVALGDSLQAALREAGGQSNA